MPLVNHLGRAGAALSVLLPALAAAQGAPTQNNVLTQNVVFGPAPADSTDATGLTTNGAVLPFFFFDTRVGTLNSITFASSYQISSAITVAAGPNGASGSVYVQSGARFGSDVSGVAAALDQVVNDLVDPVDGTKVTFGGASLTPIAFDLRGGPTAYALAAGGVAPAVSTATASRSAVVTDPNVLAAFSRVGTVSYNPLFSTLTGLVVNDTAGSASAAQLATTTGTLTISYNITPLATGGTGGTGDTTGGTGTGTGTGTGGAGAGAVPEPAGWATMILGMGAVGLALRRRVRASEARFDARIKRIAAGELTLR